MNSKKVQSPHPVKLRKKTSFYTAINPQISAKAKANNVRVSFKNTRETADAIKGMSLTRAKSFLKHVLSHQECVPFKRYVGGVGHTAQAKNHKRRNGSIGRWPKKSVLRIMELLKNAESNAVVGGKDVSLLYVSHISVNKASVIHRRMYRAHGRVNPFNSNPSHIEIVLSERQPEVKPPRKKKTQESAVTVSK